MKIGQVIWVDLGQTFGREQSGNRPAVVVSSREHLTWATDLLTVVPCTTRDRGWINHIKLAGETGLDRPTYAMSEQIRTVSRQRPMKRVGLVSEACLDQLLQWSHRWIEPIPIL